MKLKNPLSEYFKNNPKLRIVCDITITVCMILLVIYFYNARLTCEDLFDIHIICPCAELFENLTERLAFNQSIENITYTNSTLPQLDYG